MKVAINVLPLAALTTAFILPSEQVLGELTIEDHHHDAQSWYENAVDTKDEVLSQWKEYFGEAEKATEDAWTSIADSSKSVLDDAMDRLSEATDDLNDDLSSLLDFDLFEEPHHPPPPPPHHGPEHDAPPHHPPPPPHHGPPPPHHGKPGRGRRPHHPPHHHDCKPNETIWQLISKSKYTTQLAKYVSEYDDLVDALNSTKANFTLFAPTDKAFEKIPKHAPKPTKEQIEAVLKQHVVDGVYPAGRVLRTHTAPTLLKNSVFDEPQRLTFKLSLRGLLVNFRSRVVAADIFATNGVIHGIDTIILPPFKALRVLDVQPSVFSTLSLGLAKTGLYEKLNKTGAHGGTLFAPSNFAFRKLGPRINAFLFSSHGEKYLKALLEYHVVPDIALFSDALYKKGKSSEDVDEQGLFHIDLPTLLKDRSLSVDIIEWGRFTTIRINGLSSIGLADVSTKDGVIHVARNVLIPPKQLAAADDEDDEEELTVEDLCARLEPYVAKGDL